MTEKLIKRRFYAISFLYTLSASIIWGVNTLFLLASGLNIQEVFIANAFFTAGSALFEIPTGVLADTKGRRFSFLMSLVVLCIGTAGYVAVNMFSGGLFLFCVFSVLLGLGFTFYTGAVEAWVVDELKSVGFKEDLDPIFATGAAVSGIAMLIGTIGGGFLGTIDIAYPYFVRTGLLFVLFFFGLIFMKERGFTPHSAARGSYWTSVKAVTRNSIQFGWRQPAVRLMMITTSILSVFMMWGFYSWQPYLLDMLGKPDAVWISGLIAAGVALSMVCGNIAVSLLRRLMSRRTTIITIGILAMAAGSAAIGAAASFTVAVALFFMMFASGAVSPVKQAFLHSKTPSQQRATVISFDSLVGSIGGVLGQTALGWIGRRFSLSLGYLIGGGILFLAAPVQRVLAARKEPEDKIAIDPHAP
jgi:MFS family permease